MASILLVEDDAAHRRTIELALGARGFAVTAVEDGRSAREAVDVERPDLILLDLGLPDIDGIDLCRQLRVWPDAPIVVVSGDGHDDRIVTALAVGADDYVVKPVAVDVLVARIGVQLRHAAATAPLLAGQILESGDLRLDTAAHEVQAGGRPVDLNPQQFAVLAILVRNAGRVVTHDVLARAIGRDGERLDRNALRVSVSRMRRRLGDGPARPRIVTERPIGYRLEPPVAASFSP